MIKRTYFLKFERIREDGMVYPSWKVVEVKSIFKPNIVKLVVDELSELGSKFPSEEINLIYFKKVG